MLVVDDDPDAAVATELFLTACGYEVRVARHPREATAAATAFPPDAVVVGTRGRGADPVRQAASWPGRRPVLVAVSAYPEVGEEARRAGYDHALLKPADPAVLAGLLARCERG